MRKTDLKEEFYTSTKKKGVQLKRNFDANIGFKS
jgi:hypothetical protein